MLKTLQSCHKNLKVLFWKKDYLQVHLSYNKYPIYFFIILCLNLTVEQVRPEFNSRVNYSLKYSLVETKNNETIRMQNKTRKLCFSRNTTGRNFWIGYSC